MNPPSIEIIAAHAAEWIPHVRELILEYGTWLGIDLNFQGFEEELAALPGDYVPPNGRLLLALVEAKPAGCIALRPLDEGMCEMKRLYVRPAFRNLGIGETLSRRIIESARTIGYARMRLDTIPKLSSANRLYEKLGFADIPPYYFNPIPNVRYMELTL